VKTIKNALTLLSLKDEIKLIFKNKYHMIDVLDFNTMFSEHSELSQGNYGKVENIKNFLTPLKISNNFIKKPIIREGNSEANIIFVNGICSSLDVAKYQRDTLSILLKNDIELLYNQTDGFILDIIECVQDRLKHDISKAAIEVSEILFEKLKTNKEVIVIGYSQGTIITTKAIQILSKKIDAQTRKKIKLITFANACKTFSSDDVQTEHFINKKDPICKLGYIEYKENISGKAFFQDKHGHLLIADYLSHIDRFENYKKSLFYSLIS